MVTDAPKRIWLQLYGDSSEEGYPSVEQDEVTWCQDMIYDDDVEYVQADTVGLNVNERLRAEVVRLREALEKIVCRTGDIALPEAVALDTMRGLWEIATNALPPTVARDVQQAESEVSDE